MSERRARKADDSRERRRQCTANAGPRTERLEP
jgi:hypothetical protein